MKNKKYIKIGDYIKFLKIDENSIIDKTKVYKILSLDSYKRKGEFIYYITIKDDKNQKYRFKVNEDLFIFSKNKHLYEKEYEITNSLFLCIMHRDECERDIHKYLKELYNISESSKSNEYKNLVVKINSKEYDEKIAIEALGNLQSLIEKKAYQVGLKIGNYKFELDDNNDFQDEVDYTDYEKEVMNSFRDGEQDRFGY